MTIEERDTIHEYVDKLVIYDLPDLTVDELQVFVQGAKFVRDIYHDGIDNAYRNYKTGDGK